MELTELKVEDIPIKLYFECIPCSNVNGCEDTEEVQVSFIKATPTTKIQINRDTENPKVQFGIGKQGGFGWVIKRVLE